MTERETGQLIEQVTQLCTAITRLTERVEAMEKRMAYGRGALAALLTVSSAVGAIGASVVHWMAIK